MKKLFVSLLLATGVMTAQAGVTGNFGLASDYRFRGVSQTQNAMAVQGGVDFAHRSGFYVGNWNSSVSSQVYTSGAGIESDVYAGVRKDLLGVTIDIGTMNYFYAQATNFNTNEIYAGVSKGPISIKASQALSDYFGTANSKYTMYYQADLALPITKTLSVVAHAGRTDVNNSSTLDYNDYNIGLGMNVGKWTVSGRYHTNTNMTTSFRTANTVNSERNFKDAFVISVGTAF